MQAGCTFRTARATACRCGRIKDGGPGTKDGRRQTTGDGRRASASWRLCLASALRPRSSANGIQTVRTLMLAGLILVLVLGCSPHLADRPELPTAIPGLVSNDVVFATPGPRQTRTPANTGPTSTPAPWATRLPPTPLPPAPVLGHDLAGHENCSECHTLTSFYKLPADHAKRSLATCLGCHGEPIIYTIPAIPHPVAGHEACLVCHLQGKGGAPVEPGDHAGRMNDTCVNCHKPQ